MRTELTFGRWIWKWGWRIVAGLVVLAAAVYLGDWAIWRVRVAAGGGMGKVAVSQFVVAPLKGNKEEYYPNGQGEVDCSLSAFPQAGAGACWWVRRHPVVFLR